ncbi:HlyD family type I secretion periplasmic adaptor subunit [Ensifer soli]|uniref:HlyD family type I secretion periplasmic adaptor subunit n=1 Tax=Ciceribacter sp. sgz301302 TaxID=3342379 RepID=UPI0035B7C580
MPTDDRTIARLTSVRGALLTGGLATALFLGGFSAWAFGVPLAGAVIAPGRVVTDGNVQVVRHERGGVLARLDAREGMEVAAGDVLATLSRAEDRAAAEEMRSRVASLTVKQARLAAEQAGEEAFSIARGDLPEAARTVPPARFAALLADQQNEFASRRRQLADALAVLFAQRRALEEQARGLDSDRAALESQRRSLGEDIRLRRAAVARGLGRESVLRELERQDDGLKGGIDKALAQISALDHQRAEIGNRMAAERSAFLQKVGDELSRVRSESLEAIEALAGKADAVARIEVRAPVDGVVNKLHVNTVGSAVEPFAPMVEIVARRQPLVIEARVQPSDIDDVYPGQPARVVLSAFNRHLYDAVTATVVFVGADARQDQPDQEPYYTVRLSVPEPERAKLPAILPGMPSEAYLSTHERSFAAYIAEPFIQSFERAFRQ